MSESFERICMRAAIEQMRSSLGKGPKVGAVLAVDGQIVASGSKQTGVHAERNAIETATNAGVDLRRATLFTTLEPCVSIDSNRESCAELISRVGIKTVYIGRYDANPHIYRAGWKLLRYNGATLRDFEPDLRGEIDAINQEFIDYFSCGTGPVGGARFDYQQNNGKFEIKFSNTDERSIVTQWTNRGANSIYAYAVRPVQVALARYAREFSEIDDPTALDFTYTVPVGVGEIAAFSTADGAVLVKILEVESGSPGGSAQRYLKIEYEVRAR